MPCFTCAKNEVFAMDNDKRDAMFDILGNAFNGVDSVMDSVPERAEQRWNSIVLEMLTSHDALLLRHAALELTKGCASANDGTVIEMLTACDDNVLETLTRFPRARAQPQTRLHRTCVERT